MAFDYLIVILCMANMIRLARQGNKKKPIHATSGNHGDNPTEICSIGSWIVCHVQTTVLCVIPGSKFEINCPCACVGVTHSVISRARIIALASTAPLLLMSYLAAA